jgi:hypothetical protein
LAVDFIHDLFPEKGPIQIIFGWGIAIDTPIKKLTMAKGVKKSETGAAPKKAAAKKAAAKKTSAKGTAKKAAPKKAAAKAATKKAGAKKTNKLGVKNSLVNNINAKKKKGTSKSKKNSSVDKESYKNMENNWGKKE